MDHMTAKVSCFARAFHHKHHQVHIFDDWAAETLLGADYGKIAENMMNGIRFFLPGYSGSPEEGLCLIVDQQLSPSVLGRSAFCEGMLENEKRLGCRQYVLFASGYDTYSMRNTDDTLRVFELDLPEMLKDKISRMKAANVVASTTYVPCNLAETAWTEQLLSQGYRPEEKTFGSLLGISYYLKKEEFKNLLRSIHKIMAEGSAICFDYPSLNEGKASKTNRVLAQGAGEPMKALYSYQELELLLQECGFLIYEHLNEEEMTHQYFSEYNAGNPDHPMQAPKGVGYILAVKKN